MFIRCLTLAALALVPSIEAQAAAPPADVAAFFRQHCFDCHAGAEVKGGLNLQRLAPDFADGQAARTWIDVFDKLASGQMPPNDQPRPVEQVTSRVLAWLKQSLLAAEADERRAGRVVLRRLNRVEYEHTVHDLFGIETAVRDLLPEDQQAAGFDNIGSALNVSSILLERYLEAADAVLDDLFVSGNRPAVETKRYYYKDEPTVQKKDSRIFLLRDEGLVAFSSTYSPTEMRQARAPVDGPYRIRVRAKAWQSPDKPVTFAVYVGQLFRPGGRRQLAGFFDVTADQTRPVELTVRMEQGETLKVHPYAIGDQIYQIGAANYKGAGLLIESVEVEGPLLPTWPPAGYSGMFGNLDLSQATVAGAEQALRWLLPRAFRRPVTDDDLKPYLEIVREQFFDGQSFDKAMRVAIKALLTSPDFLFFRETLGELDQHAIASRLSYFLWSSTPDDVLREAASAGQLATADQRNKQVERMLADPKAARFTEDFCGQWLGLRLIDFTSPDMKLYPEFDELLRVSMVEETRLFFDELLKNNQSLVNFLDCDWSILNERLAEHYGITGVKGQEFRRVKFSPDSHRGGVLTMASVLKITANGTTTSPVIRGAWVLRNILGQPPKPPPANVPAVEPDIRGAKTIREQLAAHRTVETCGVCHKQIDPPGNALENFDVIGGWRERYRTMNPSVKAGVKFNARGTRFYVRLGSAVDPHDELADGRPFADIDQLKQLLVADKDRFARCLAEKLLTYASGGELTFGDRDAIDVIVARVRSEGYGFRSLVHEVVASPIFLSK